jgi:anaerobic magnesium-protoporphyrin IX monomethyl ester cyclase
MCYINCMTKGTEITLISPYSDISSIGIRILSAILKKSGIPVKILFIPHIPSEKSASKDSEYGLDNKIIDATVDFCSDSDFVGISVMSHYFDKAVQLTKKIKLNTHIKIIWGGIHPTIRPVESLEFADIVGRGECESSIKDLLLSNGENTTIKNFWFRNVNEIIKNDPSPLIQNIDEIPFQDYDLEGHNVWDDESKSILKIDEKLLEKYLDLGHISRIRLMTAYQTLATRGCPHNCAYCCNNAITSLYNNQKTLRRRSPENIIEELSLIKEKFNFIKIIGFSDDSFFAASNENISKFAELYKEKIDLPFFCLGSPLTITESKLDTLIKAGMFGIQMGIQTGSENILDLYNRKISNEMVIKASKVISKFGKKIIPPVYDIILDNPFESVDDNIRTFKLISKLEKPYKLQLFSLVLFPETALYNKAVKEGFIKDDIKEIYRKNYHHRKSNYVNFLFGLYRYNFPLGILKILTNENLVRFLSKKAFDGIFGLFYGSFKLAKRSINLVLNSKKS